MELFEKAKLTYKIQETLEMFANLSEAKNKTGEYPVVGFDMGLDYDDILPSVVDFISEQWSGMGCAFNVFVPSEDHHEELQNILISRHLDMGVRVFVTPKFKISELSGLGTHTIILNDDDDPKPDNVINAIVNREEGFIVVVNTIVC